MSRNAPYADPDRFRAIVEGAVAIARDRLGMDIGWLSEFGSDGEQVFRTVDVRGKQRWDLYAGKRIAAADGYCQRVLDGRIPAVVPDARLEPELRDLAVTKALGIRAYIGVPVTLASGVVYGTLCCASSTPDPDRDERDVEFLETLAHLVAGAIEAQELVAERARIKGRSEAVDALLAALEARDRYTRAHVREVVELAVRVARRLGLDEEEVADVELVALLHDIGKIAIPDAILHKPGPLDDDELAVIRRHTILGGEVVGELEPLASLAPSIRATHERWDGGGYPDGLAGEEIPVVSRISFVCDAFDAMCSDRPYRRSMPLTDAVAELRACSGTQFWPAATDAVLAEIALVGVA